MKTKIVIICLAIFASINLKAQQQKDEIQMIQSMWGIEKRDIVKDYMKLNENEAAEFWPVYDKFQEELRKLGKERIMIIDDYVNNVSTITNDKADELAVKVLNNNTATDKLMKKYYGKMKNALNPIRALSYMQLEYYLQTIIRAHIQNSIPFIGELDKKANEKK